jgi:hypothetical protein
MYYLMQPVFRDDTITIDQVSHWDYSLTLGVPLPSDMPVPIEYKIDARIGGSHLPTTFLPEPVFALRFVEALKQAGVDNFDSYPATITNGETGAQIQGYVALNVLGTVACADLGASDSDPLIESQHVIRKLVIDPSRTHGFLLFRLAEWTQMILVHEHVVSRIPAELRRDLTFEVVKER